MMTRKFPWTVESGSTIVVPLVAPPSSINFPDSLDILQAQGLHLVQVVVNDVVDAWADFHRSLEFDQGNVVALAPSAGVRLLVALVNNYLPC